MSQFVMNTFHSTLSASAWIFLSLLSFGLYHGRGATSAPENDVPADSVAVFNEIMYHPQSDDPAEEWIELHNQMSVDVDLSNWELTGGVRFRFVPGTVLSAGSYVVVAASPSHLEQRYGITTAHGPWLGKLNNAGDQVTLRNHNGRLMDQISYSDDSPWPPGADGSGASLAKTRRLTPSGPASNWRASSQLGGTPGRVNFPFLDGAPATTRILLGHDSASRYLIPTAAVAANAWTELSFDDRSWLPGTSAVGYDLSGTATGTNPPVERYYSLDSTLADGSGNGFDALSTSTTFSTNVPPGSAATRSTDFSGTSAFLQIPDPLDPTAYTIAGWVRFDSIRVCSLVVRTDASGPTTTWSHQLRMASGGKLQHYVFDGGGQLISGTNVLVRSRWYHVAITARNGGLMKLFLNGVQEGPSRTIGNLWTGGDQWRFGSNGGESPSFFDGQLSGIGIWHEELSPETIGLLASGASPLLLNGLGSLIGTDLRTSLPGVNSSLWLRTPFTLPSGGNYSGLSFDVQYADGFVAWLNGREIARRNAPTQLDWNSAATADRPALTAVRTESMNLSNQLALLRPGANVLAVQALNLTAQESNFLFAAQLKVSELPIDTDSLKVTFNELPSALSPPFWMELYNDGETAADLTGLQIRRGAQTISTLPSTQVEAKQSVVISWPSTTPAPQVGDRIHLLSADEKSWVDSATVAGLLQGRKESDPRGEWFRPVAPTPGAPNHFEWEGAIVINEIMYHHAPSYPKAGTPASTTNTLLVEFGNSWRYDNQSVDLGQAWREPSFDDSTWSNAPAPLGTMTGTPPLPIKTPLSANGRTTVYFRTDFEVSSKPSQFKLLLTSLIDDGAIFYLNGKEVLRRNLTNGPVTSATRALTNIGTVTMSLPFPIASDTLVLGRNTLAVEVHQAVTNASADFMMATRLHISEDLAPGTPSEPFAEIEEEWIELYNSSPETVNLSGWRLTEAVDYLFPNGTLIPGGGFLVVARDATTLRTKYPNIEILGDYEGRLSDSSERIRLLDAHHNPADEVRYYGRSPWPEAADGGGSSLELTDPRADNAVPESWEASDESGGAPWQRYTIRATAITPSFTPAISGFNELRLCLLDSGEALIDNVSVVEEPGFTPKELIQNGTFETGLTKWRKTGTHIHTFVDSDPDHPGNRVLRLVATGPGSYLNNIIETTLKNGTLAAPVVAGREYQISFDAKWISGSPLLRAELYYNKVAATRRLTLPAQHGTPGRRNSRFVTNSGPTFKCLAHEPAVPRFRTPVTVRVQADDPDGVAEMTLFYAATGKAWSRTNMTLSSTGFYEATLPGQSNVVQLQFYVSATDGLNVTSLYPPGGTNSRAYIKVENTLPSARVPFLRILADPKQAQGLMPMTNLLSDDFVECTIVLGEKEVIYGGGFRLHGSMHSRQTADNNSFTLRFPADHPYRGIRTSLILRRRDLGEIVCRHLLANAPDVPGNYDDLAYLVSPPVGSGSVTRILFGNDDDIWAKSQFDGQSAQVYKMEGIREFTTTDNGTPEGYKLAIPIGWVQSFDLIDQGNDQEQYRWTTMISNRRAQDDYSRYIAMSKVFGMTGTNLQRNVPAVMDVDEWSKVFGLQSLCGVADVYTVENPHNLGYLVRPTDGRMLALQNDWSFPFQRDTGSPLIGVQNLSKIFNLPVYRRVYYGNILHLLNTTFNRAYMARWTQHYGNLTGESYSGYLDYIGNRSASARTQIGKQIPFEITSNGGQSFSTNSPVGVISGRGWVDVFKVALGTTSNEVSLTWLDADKWQLPVALAPGTNILSLTAFDRSGAVVGADSIEINATFSDRPQFDGLRISEIMYHPSDPSEAEIAAGFSDSDDFEFVEIANISAAPVSLKGAQFVSGVSFTFQGLNIYQLEPGQRVVVVKNLAAFSFRYPSSIRVAGAYAGSLDNSGEWLRLADSFGTVIDEVRYGDSGEWPESADGQGKSLERLSFQGSANSALNWQASSGQGGTPGTASDITPQLEIGVNNDGTLDLRAVVPGGKPHQLQSRARLDTGSWSALRSLPAAANARVEHLTETPPAGSASQFYRLVAE
jgi:hypothetical protein